MRVLSLFSGIGAFEKALTNLNVSYELVNYCEIDKYASRAYSLIHNIPEERNLVDVTKVNTRNLKDIDLITYGFPCQDISNAGLQKGFADDDGNTTRSGLFFEALRIIRETRPGVAIAENVKALTSKKFESEFTTVLGSLSRLGYNNYYKVLNAKDYGIPQNRERVFIVSIRQDLDKGFSFPGVLVLKKRLGDYLENDADEKYFLSESRINSLMAHKERHKEKGNGFGARLVTGTDIASGLTTSPDKSAGQYIKVSESEIRKLTPLESLRLMGFDDQDFYKLRDAEISDFQIYKQAGNSIVVDVIQAIFEELIKRYPDMIKIKLPGPKSQISLDEILKEINEET